MDTRWLTYDELAAVLRITAGSARRLVGRNKHWSRKPGNDGRVRIGVPVERLPADNSPDPREAVAPDTTPAVIGTISALSHHIETLKGALAKAEAATERERERAERLEGDLGATRRDLEEERTRRVVAEVEAAVAPALRVTVEALKCALGTEQGRVGELRAERDRLARWSWWPFRRAG
jgi:hypothetical protein